MGYCGVNCGGAPGLDPGLGLGGDPLAGLRRGRAGQPRGGRGARTPGCGPLQGKGLSSAAVAGAEGLQRPRGSNTSTLQSLSPATYLWGFFPEPAAETREHGSHDARSGGRGTRWEL